MFIMLSWFDSFSGRGATIREGTLIRRNTVHRLIDWFSWWSIPFSTLFQLYFGSQCTSLVFSWSYIYRCSIEYSFTATGCFPLYTHCSNDGRWWEKNESFSMDSKQSSVRNWLNQRSNQREPPCSQALHTSNYRLSYRGWAQCECIYTPSKWMFLGVYWNQPVCLSMCLSVCKLLFSVKGLVGVLSHTQWQL